MPKKDLRNKQRRYTSARGAGENQTASVDAARRWLDRRRPPDDLALFFEGVNLATKLKSSMARAKQAWKTSARREKQAERAAQQLKEKYPDVIAQIEFMKAESWMQFRASLSSLAPRSTRQSRARFTRALAALLGEITKERIEGLTALVWTLAAQVVGIKPPSKLEAAALAVATGLEGPTKLKSSREESWKTRMKVARARAQQLLVDPPDEQHATIFDNEPPRG